MRHTARCQKDVQLADFTTHKCERGAVFRLFHPKTGKTVQACRQHTKALHNRGWLMTGAAS